jgi:uncharacterized coiled-coil DUF342 family protein
MLASKLASDSMKRLHEENARLREERDEALEALRHTVNVRLELRDRVVEAARDLFSECEESDARRTVFATRACEDLSKALAALDKEGP